MLKNKFDYPLLIEDSKIQQKLKEINLLQNEIQSQKRQLTELIKLTQSNCLHPNIKEYYKNRMYNFKLMYKICELCGKHLSLRKNPH